MWKKWNIKIILGIHTKDMQMSKRENQNQHPRNPQMQNQTPMNKKLTMLNKTEIGWTGSMFSVVLSSYSV